MPRFKIVKEFSSRPDFPLFCVLDSLANTFSCIGAGCDIEESLVRFCVLYNGSRFALDRQDDWAFSSFELFYEVAGATAEGCQRLNVACDIEHEVVPMTAPF